MQTHKSENSICYEWSLTGLSTSDSFTHILNTTEYYCSVNKKEKESSSQFVNMLMRPLDRSLLVSCQTGPCSLNRRSEEIKNIEDPKINLTFISCGQERIEYNNNTIIGQCSDLLLLPNHLPLTCRVPKSLHKITLTIPESKATLLIPNIEELYGTKVSLASGMGAIAAATFREMGFQISEVDSEINDDFIDFIVLMLDNCFAKKNDAFLSKTQKYLFIQACKYIGKNIEDPDLTQAKIAESLQISKRYLQSIFSHKGYTINRYIQNIRLELFRKCLIKNKKKKLNISEIAYKFGANDLSYFIKIFKRQYGITPSQYRKQLTLH